MTWNVEKVNLYRWDENGGKVQLTWATSSINNCFLLFYLSTRWRPGRSAGEVLNVTRCDNSSLSQTSCCWRRQSDSSRPLTVTALNPTAEVLRQTSRPPVFQVIADLVLNLRFWISWNNERLQSRNTTISKPKTAWQANQPLIISNHQSELWMGVLTHTSHALIVWFYRSFPVCAGGQKRSYVVWWSFRLLCLVFRIVWSPNNKKLKN